MNILLASSEVTPFSKTGGLADVCGALPIDVARLGHPTTVITPAYRSVWHSGRPIEPMGIRFIVPIGSKTVSGQLLRSSLPGGEVPVYLVQQDQYFDRDHLYNEGPQDYPDNCERFIFFCRAALEAIRLLQLDVDVIHANDWQTGLIPAYLKIEYAGLDRYRDIASLMTIHNISFQGTFWHWDMLLTGLNWRYFNWHQMEFHGKLNLLKTGIVFADSINTVSPRYAEEIQSHPQGWGLEGVLAHRREVLSGIVNGVDYNVWNPATDPRIAQNYDADHWAEGKRACKAALQRAVGLPASQEPPLVGIVSRLTGQKGMDLTANLIQQWVHTRDAQWVILGCGERYFEDRFAELAREFPNKVAFRREFSDVLAHQIEAGADLFLMPSRFEPCGLNQLYSLKYGTVPVVRATGGLADTIVDATPETLAAGTATGFVFHDYNELALENALDRACHAYRHQPDVWAQLITTGMRQDWSWRRSAEQYVELYHRTVSRARG